MKAKNLRPVMFLMLFLVVMLPIVIFLAQQKQESRSMAAGLNSSCVAPSGCGWDNCRGDCTGSSDIVCYGSSSRVCKVKSGGTCVRSTDCYNNHYCSRTNNHCRKKDKKWIGDFSVEGVSVSDMLGLPSNPTPTKNQAPTKTPTKTPTKIPTKVPTKYPTNPPTKTPTKTPTPTQTTINPSSLILTPSDINLYLGDSLQITAKVKPDNASNKTVNWSSNNANIASVSVSGKVTTKTTGTTNIIAKTINNITATTKITVLPNPVTPTPTKTPTKTPTPTRKPTLTPTVISSPTAKPTAADTKVVKTGKYIDLQLYSEELSFISDANLNIWLSRLDLAYEDLAELTGWNPFNGKIVIDSIECGDYCYGWAWANINDNYIGWAKKWWQAEEFKRIDKNDDWSFGILHEISHKFDNYSSWGFMDNEMMANFKLAYFLEKRNAKVQPNNDEKYYFGNEIVKVYKENKDNGYDAILEKYRLGKRDELRNTIGNFLNYKFLVMKEEIGGWGTYKQVFRNLQSKTIDSENKKINAFLDEMSFVSKKDVRKMFNLEEQAILEIRFGNIFSQNVTSTPTYTPTPTLYPAIITGIVVSPNPLNLEVGTSWALNVTTVPKGLSAVYEWVSDNANIATVNNNGLVTGKIIGETNVRVTVKGTNISYWVKVVVKSGPTPTDSDPQPVSDVKVSFMVSLGGIKPNAECISKYLIPQTKMSSDVINVTGLSDGVYQNEILSSFEVVDDKTDTLGNQVFKVTIDQKDEDNEGLDKNIFGSVDTYNWIKVKGPFHLKKRMCQDNQSSKLSETDVCDIDLKASNTSVYDFSEYTLSSGDIDKSGIINTADLSYVKSRLDAGADINCGVEGDLNMDGVVNSIDLGLVKQSLRERDNQ